MNTNNRMQAKESRTCICATRGEETDSTLECQFTKTGVFPMQDEPEAGAFQHRMS